MVDKTKQNVEFTLEQKEKWITFKKLENESIYIFRQSFRSIKNIAMLWSLGKDSNVMMWLAFKAFLGKLPFPVVHVDTKKNLKKCMNLEIFTKRNGNSIS